MAETTKVRSSNFRPVKSGHEFVEVSLTNDAATATGTASAAIPLRKSYRSIKPVSIAASYGSAQTAYADTIASVVVVDMSSVKMLYKAAANVTVTATLECEE